MNDRRLHLSLLISLMLFSLFLICPTAEADFFPDLSSPDSSGVADEVHDMAYVLRSDKRHRLTEGFELRNCDTIWTGTTGTAKLRLLDDTEIELGPDTTMHLMEVVYKPDEARLEINFDRGFVRIKTGSIGLKNPNGIKIVTPKSHLTLSNAYFSITAKQDKEIVQVEWMSKGSIIAAYSPISRKYADIAESGSVLFIDSNGEIYSGTFEGEGD